MTTIKLKNGSGAPLAGDLVQGEPALDLTNKRLYTEDSGGTVIEVGTNPSTINIDAGTIDGTVIGGSTAAAITGTTITGTSFVSSGDMTFGDNDKAIFGAGSDLQIYHDGSNSYIVDNGTGDLLIRAENNLFLKRTNSDETYLSGAVNGAVTLFHNNNAKLETTISGIDVTGGLTTTGNVGIGTASPSRLLTLSGTGATLLSLVSTDDDNCQILFGDSASDTVGKILYRHSDNSMAFEINAAERMRIDSSGDLLVGKTSLDVGVVGQELRSSGFLAATRDGSTVGAYTRLNSDGTILEFRKDSSAIGSIGCAAGSFGIGQSNTGLGFFNTDRIVFPATSSGAVQDNAIDLGYASGRFKNLYLSGQTFGGDGAANVPSYAFGNDTNMGMYRAGNNILGFSTSSAERVRIDGSGNFRVGISTDPSVAGSEGIELNGSNGFITTARNTAAAAGHHQFVNSNGVVGTITTSGSSTTYGTSSDYRLKENVVPLTGATERVKQLNPSRFNFIVDADTTVDGFLAHEVADVVPEAISGTKDAMRDEEYEVTPAVYEDVVIPAVLDEEGNEVEAERTEQQLVTEAVMGTRSVPDYQGIDQSKLVPLLVATIQELEARITALESN